VATRGHALAAVVASTPPLCRLTLTFVIVHVHRSFTPARRRFGKGTVRSGHSSAEYVTRAAAAAIAGGGHLASFGCPEAALLGQRSPAAAVLEARTCPGRPLRRQGRGGLAEGGQVATHFARAGPAEWFGICDAAF
jgi:hypothetical protein